MNQNRPKGYGNDNKVGTTYAGYGGGSGSTTKKKSKKRSARKIEKKGDIAELQR